MANPVPVFPDQDPVEEGEQTEQERDVAEDAKRGDPVGAPFTAIDDDVLTWTIYDGHEGVGTGKSASPSTNFSIDMASGQIKVGGAKLNYEADATTDDANDNDRYLVTVTATDANDASADVKVTIIVTNVDEAPEITGPASAASEFAAPENFTVIDADGVVAADTEISTADPPVFTPGIPAVYTATEQDAGDSVSWSVEGADGAKFSISGGTLAFKKAPDYEAKGSVSGTNRYKVTIVASDLAGNRDTMNAIVVVRNRNEPGSIKLSSVQPQIDRPITATLSDPDGVIGKITWQWLVDGTEVDSANKATFTPREGQDEGDPLSVRVDMYKDGEVGADGENQTVAAVSQTYLIREKQTSNRAPVFRDDEENRVTSYVREIKENNTVGNVNSNVGEAVDATDADESSATSPNNLTYTLGGADKDSFEIDRGQPTSDTDRTPVDPGQIKAKIKLDYEKKSVYTVTVTATDGSGASATVTVTINVIDVGA